MKLYILTRKDGPQCEGVHGFVVRACSPRAARNIAMKRTGDNFGNCIWRSPRHSSCKELKLEGIEGILLDGYQPRNCRKVSQHACKR